MSKYSGRNNITVGVSFQTDQASVRKLQDSLRKITQIKPKNFSGMPEDLRKAKDTARQLEAALQKAFNVKLGSLNVDTFTKSLGLSSTKINQIYTNLSKVGAVGKVAFNDMTTAVLTTNTKLKETQGLISRMGQTMANTIKWGIASSVMNNFTNSVRQAFDYVKALDSALTDIRIVTGDSTEKMAQFADQANRAAQELGRSTMDYSKAALTFYQQGLGDEQVAARTEATLKAQNITGAGQEMANYLTAVWNGYKVANEEAELYVDKLAAVADSSASNMSQLAIAMSKVAATANMLGVPVDSLNAQIATIVATTRQAPESVGNALKTIYARINDIATGADDAQISLGNYTSKMAEVGISVLDANGRLRDTGDVIEEIGGKWDTLSREQQIYLARTMAGQRQYNNLLALFENWSKYSDLVNISMQSQGTTMQKNSRYMDSLAAHMEQFGAAGERVKAALIDEDDLKGLVSFGTNAVNLFASLIESIGGGKNALLTFGSIFTQVFSGTIAAQLNNAIIHFQNLRNNNALMQQEIQKITQFGQSKGYEDGTIKYLIDAKQELKNYYDFITPAQKNQYDNLLKEQAARKNNIIVLKEQADQVERLSNIIKQARKGITDEGAVFFGETAIKNIQESKEKIQDLFSEVNDTKNKNIRTSQGQGKYITELINQFEADKGQYTAKFLKDAEQTALGENSNFEERLKVLSEVAKNGKMDIDGLRRAVEDYLKILNVAQDNAGVVASSEDTKRKLEEQEEAYRRAEKAREEYLSNIKQAANVKAFVGLAAGLGQMASGLNNIVNLTKIWKNDSLSAGEKIRQTFTNIGMTIPMLVNGFSQVVKNGKGAVLAIKTLTATRLFDLNATYEEAKAIALKNKMTEEEAIAEAKAAVANKIHAVSLKEVAIAAWEALTPLLPFIAAGAAIAGSIYLMYKAWNKEAEASQKAAQSAAKAKETYDNIKQSYDELKSSLEDYNSAQIAIESLTKGTQEWRDAIRESNDSVLELLNNYPRLAQYIENVNGQLKISQEGQDYLLQSMSDAVDATRGASILASSNARSAANTATAAGIGHEVWTTSAFGGSVASRYATADEVTKVVQALHGDLSQFSGKVFQSTDQAVQQISQATGVQADIVAQLLSRGEDLQKLTIAIDENTAATDLATKSLVQDKLQDDSTYKALDKEGKALADQIGANAYQAAANNLLNDKSYFADVTRFTTANNASMQNILSAFQAAMGDASITFAKNAVTAGGEMHFLIDGQQITYSKQQVAQIIASSQALEDLGVSAKIASDMLADFRTLDTINNNSTSKALSSFVSGQNFDNLTKEELSGIDLTSEDLASIYDKYKTTFQQLGYDSSDIFISSFNEQLESSKELFDNIGNTALGSVKTSLQTALEKSNFTFGQAKGLENAFSEAFKHAGTVGLKGLESVLSDTSNLTEKQLQGLSEAINNIDWTQNGAAYELTKALEEQGIYIDDSTGAWGDFLTKLEEVSSKSHNAASAIDDVRSSLKELKDLQDLDTGDIIDDQQYNELIKMNPQLQKFFMITADGYAYLADKGDISTVVGQSVDQTIAHFHQLESAAAALEQKDYASKIGKIDFSDVVNTQVESLKDLTTYSTLNNALSLIGVDQDALAQAITTVENYQKQLASSGRGISEEQKQRRQQQAEEANAFIKESFDKAIQMQADYENELYNDDILSQLIATQSDSLTQLGMLFAENVVHGDDFAAALRLVSEAQMEALGFDTSEYENFVELLAAANPELAENEYLLRNTAKAMMRVQRGTEQLVDNWEDWSDALADFRDNQDFSELIDSWDDIKSALADLYNMDIEAVDLLGPDFVADNLDKIQAVVDGADGAYEELEAIMNQDLQANVKANIDVDDTNLQAQITNDFDLLEQFANQDFIATADMDDSGVLAAAQRIVDASNWSSEQAQAAFSQLGYDIEVEGKDGQLKTDSEETQYYVPPTYKMVPKTFNFGPFGHGTMMLPELDTAGHYESAGAGVKQSYEPGHYAIKAITPNGRSSGGNISRNVARGKKDSGGKKGGGGGGGSKGKTPKATKVENPVTNDIDAKLKETINNPYQQIEKSYDRQVDKIKKLDNLQKKVTGKKRLDVLNKQNDALKQQNKIIRERQRISESGEPGSTSGLLGDLERTFGKQNLTEKDGRLKNETALQNQAVNEYNTATKKAVDTYKAYETEYNNWLTTYWNKLSGDQQEARKAEKDKRDKDLKDRKSEADKAIKLAEEEYKKKTGLIDTYNKALEEDLKYHEQYLENLEQMIENKLDIINSKLELKLNIGEVERDWLEFYDKVIDRIEDTDIYGKAKSDFKKLATYFDSGELKAFQDNLASLKTLEEQVLGNNFTGFGISAADYNELSSEEKANLRESALSQVREQRAALIQQNQESLEQLYDLIDDIKDYYLDALKDADDKLDDVVDQYKRINDLIDHNVKMTELLYGDKGYQTLEKYYDLQHRNNQEILGNLMAQRAYWENIMYNSEVGSDIWKLAKENVDDLVDDINSKLEDMIENLATAFENRLDKAIQNANNKLTSGLGTDYLDEQWDYIGKLDDNFLDTVNRRFGVEDVTRAYQKALNDVAGNPKQYQKINKLMNEQLTLLKQKDKLTEYDVERAKSLLEVEQARMALEDARNNKTKMRLRRDSQGNYTYQYVADEEKLSDLEAALADAQSNLYNQDKEHYRQNLNALYDTYKEYLEKRKSLEEEYAQASQAEDEEWIARVSARIDLLNDKYSQLYGGLSEDNGVTIGYLSQSFSDAMGEGFKALWQNMTKDEQWQTLFENVPWASSNIQTLQDTISGQGGLVPALKDTLTEFRDSTIKYVLETKNAIAQTGTTTAEILDVTNENGNLYDRNILQAENLATAYKGLATEALNTVEEVENLLGELEVFLNTNLSIINDWVSTIYSATTGNLKDYLGYNYDAKSNTNRAIFSDGERVFSDTQDFVKENATTAATFNLISTDTSVPADNLNTALATAEAFKDIDTGNIADQMSNIPATMAQDLVRFQGQMGLITNGIITNNGTLDQHVEIAASFPNVVNREEIEAAFNNLVNIASMQAAQYNRG